MANEREANVNTCCVCACEFQRQMKTRCGHDFCQACLETWIKQHPSNTSTCPLCRTQLRGSSIATATAVSATTRNATYFRTMTGNGEVVLSTCTPMTREQKLEDDLRACRNMAKLFAK
jgi:hypothetical protein